MIVVALAAAVLTAPILDESFEVERIATGCKFTEGPALGPDGAIYFSDQPNDRILRWHDGQLSVFLSPCGAANGLAFDRFGNLVICQSSRAGGGRALARVDLKTREIETVTHQYANRRYIAPNDLCIDRLGRIYFTDPHYSGDRSQPTSGVYLRDVDGQVKLIIASLEKPNGILLSNDSKTLYVSDRGTQKLHRYRVNPDGTVVHDGIHYDFEGDRGIDGMCIDVAGNIYGAAGEGKTTGLFVISPAGELLLHKPMPEFSTNVTFGGDDLRDLYLTASTSVYRLRTTTPGVRPLHDRTTSAFVGPPGQLLSGGAGEGPAWSSDIGLIFSGHGQINRWCPANPNEVHSFETGHSTNGLLFDSKGRLLRCENVDRRITRREADGSLSVLTDHFEGRAYNQPNDLTIDSKGRIFFSDPKYGVRENLLLRDKQNRPIEGVYRIDLDGSVKRVITHEVDRPNGVLVTQDDRYLFVADNNNNSLGGARKLWRFEFNEQRELELENPKLIYDWGTGRGPDGMVEDQAGRIYVAAGRNRPVLPFETVDDKNRAGVYVFSVDGELLDFIAIPRDEVTNCTFGGPDLSQLFITAGGSLWRVPTNSKGALPLKP